VVSETKFTPWPWEYEPHGQMIMTDNGQKMIADIRGWGWIQYLPEGEKIQDANGYLIAAAPDMYMVLEEVFDEVENYMERTGRSVTWGEKAKAALAKARGET